MKKDLWILDHCGHSVSTTKNFRKVLICLQDHSWSACKVLEPNEFTELVKVGKKAFVRNPIEWARARMSFDAHSKGNPIPFSNI
jgi:hypothetical protein